MQAFSTGLSIVGTIVAPRAPHVGGLWEAALKSVKTDLRRVMGECVLNYGKLQAFFCQIEIFLNYRPIISLSDDPKDELPHSPADLCMGAKLEALPSTVEVTKMQSQLRKKDGLVSKQMTYFWKRWSKEYVASLQERSQWRNQVPNFILGVLV